MRHALILGDSHTAALRRGQLAIEADGRWPDDIQLSVRPLGGGHLSCEPFFADRGDHAEVTLPEYRRQFERLPLADEPPGLVYGLSFPLHPVRVWRHPDWASTAPADMRRAGPSVSSGMVRRLALDDQRYVLQLMALLKRIGRDVFAVEGPYPFRHHPALRTTPAEVVQFVDRLYRDTIRAELARLGVDVVEVPGDCLENGFTRSQYAQGDPHHGNELYGRLMMDRILTRVRASTPRAVGSAAAA